MSENEKLVIMAASVIRDEIKSAKYNVSKHPTLEETQNGLSIIPNFLSYLLDIKDKNDVISRRYIAIAHSIISACRPRPFISPILLAISIFILRKYASRDLEEILRSINFTKNYKEILRFENSIIFIDKPSYNLNGFTQFIFDNADFNVATLTGHNTFHSLGDIACVAPPSG